MLSAEVAAVLLPALATVNSLECLAVTRYCDLNKARPALLAVLSWAPQQRSLRLVEIDHQAHPAAASDPQVRAAADQAQQAAPTLRVDFSSSLTEQLRFTAEAPSMLWFP